MSWLSGSLLSTLLLGAAIYLVFILIRFLLYYRRLKKVFGNLPGYSPKQRHWLRGDIDLITKDDNINLDQLHVLIDKFPKYFCLWFGPFSPRITLVHPDTVKVLLKTAEPKPVGYGGPYGCLLPWLGNGLLVSGGEKWARSRRLLTPAFHFEILKPYQHIYNKCINVLLGIIDKYAESGESFELFQLISNCTLDIILQCAFSYHTECQNDRLQHPYCCAIYDAAMLVSKRIRNPVMYFDFLYYLTPNGRKFREKCNYIHGVADSVIESRKKALASGKEEQNQYLDFLDILLSAKDENGIGMSKEDIRAEVDTFMFEGHDTTTSGISWILYELAKHPQYQQTCQEEIDVVMKDSPGFVTWDHLSKFEFLTQCIKEGMRVNSPVPAVSRQTTKEITIEGKTFPAGTFFGINIFGVHNNPTVWKHPMKFDPSRFSKYNDTKMDSYAFIPFAAGPRNCIGQHFAMNEEKTVISRILERFTLELDPDHIVSHKLAVVMRARDGIRCFAKRRNHTVIGE